jgi:hypothetical protein
VESFRKKANYLIRKLLTCQSIFRNFAQKFEALAGSPAIVAPDFTSFFIEGSGVVLTIKKFSRED